MFQTPISDALIISEKRPRRLFFSWFVRYYSILVGLFVTLIMVVSAGPYAPYWTITWIVIYWFYYAGRIFLGRRSIWGLSYQSKWVQFGRSLLLVMVISIFLAYLYLYTDYLKENGGADALWLFFLLATFIMSQYGVTELMVVTMAAACLLLIMINWLAAPWGWVLARNLTIKVSWLVLLSFVLHILLRYLSDWYANIKLLRGVEEPIIQIRAVSDEKELLETVVKRIETEFNYPHVNIFYLQPDRGLKCVAGACQAGYSLAKSGYILEGGKGIIGHVIRTGQAYCSNDVSQTPFYYYHPAFPKTRAELVAPIKLKGEIIGVLDIQSPHSGVFFEQDIEVMEIMASLFGRVLDNIQLLRSKQQTNDIIASITRRLLSPPELESTLSQIARAAHEELKADVVVLYERNPATNKIVGPTYAGQLYQPESFNLTVLEPDSLVYRLLNEAIEEYRFDQDVQNVSREPLFAPTTYHTRSHIPPFEEREKIRSRAIICLRTGTDRVGLLFLNFRSLHRFDEQEKETIFTFAHLAALAIQKAQSHQQEIQFERKILAAQLHDQLIATTDGLSRIVSAVLSDRTLADLTG